jgi:peptidase E
MRLFLTSSPCSPYPQKDGRTLYGYSEENGFLKRLKEGWEPGWRCLMIGSDPEDAAGNDRMAKEFEGFFSISGIPVLSLVMCDKRNAADLPRLLSESRIVILAGGHVPTQNAFFRRIGLAARMKGYDGTVMGISAGTMNCAGTVYAQPELAGESRDPGYERFLSGLGLTGLMILPHYQETRDRMLDGRRLMEDITYEDSAGRVFYALADGSYVLAQDGRETLYGEAWKIEDGKIRKICGKEAWISLS